MRAAHDLRMILALLVLACLIDGQAVRGNQETLAASKGGPR